MEEGKPFVSIFDRYSYSAEINEARSRTSSDDYETSYLRKRGLRYVVLAPMQMRLVDVERYVREFLYREAHVEPLFNDADHGPVPARLRCFFLVVIEGVTASDLEQNPYDGAYSLLMNTPLIGVEPDLAFSGFTESALRTATPGNNPAKIDLGWSQRNIRADRAWKITPSHGRQDGEGVTIAHLDTGWTLHGDLDQANFDMSRAKDYIDQYGDASDPLDYFGSPGHGTRTGSVMMSKGEITQKIPPGTDKPGKITGVARNATYVPVRCIRSVIIIFNSDLARAVRYATANNCDVISMSLGGRPMTALWLAIQDAVLSDRLVLCAAGNNVKVVVWPARYPESIAMAASNDLDKPWSGSCRGRKVDISAPGEEIWVAEPDSAGVDYKTGDGTSYATAHMAGVAALWLAFHDKARLMAQAIAAGKTMQEVFRAAVKATARIPAGWNKKKFGAGIVDVEALLKVNPLFVRSLPVNVSDHAGLAPLLNDDDPEAAAVFLEDLFSGGGYGWKEIEHIFGHELANILLGDPRLLLQLREISEKSPDQEAILTARQSLAGYMSATFRKATGLE